MRIYINVNRIGKLLLGLL